MPYYFFIQPHTSSSYAPLLAVLFTNVCVIETVMMTMMMQYGLLNLAAKSWIVTYNYSTYSDRKKSVKNRRNAHNYNAKIQ